MTGSPVKLIGESGVVVFDGTMEPPAGSQAGVLAVAAANDVAISDAPTSLPCDGAQHAVQCITAAPPVWLDNAGNIIAAGIYAFYLSTTQVTPPTTPGLYAQFLGPNNLALPVPLDFLGLTLASQSARFAPGEVVNVSAADLPAGLALYFGMPTDITGAFEGTAIVYRLASASP